MSAEDYARWVLAPSLPERPTEPRSSYFVCGTPRSGTWLLCGLLWSTGVAGRPHEYFWRDTEEAAARAWGVSSFAEYLQSVLAAGTSPNGVFGSKLMWGYLSAFLERLRGVAGSASAGDGALLSHVFPRPRFVFVWREDAIAQGVSWARALQTGRWHHWDKPRFAAAPEFDFDQVDALVQQVNADHADWRRWFAENGIDPIDVQFEQLVAEPTSVARKVLAGLAVDVPDDVALAVQTVRSGDALNADWAARYRSLAELR